MPLSHSDAPAGPATGDSPSWPDAIDVHHHIVPGFYRAALAAHGLLNPVPGVEYPHWDAEASLAMMNRQGIATAVVSVTVPGVNLADDASSAALARRLNEYMADLIAGYPGRFGAFAAIPMHDTTAALREMRYALDTLELDGIGLFTNHRGRYLGDPAFDGLLREVHERGVVVHVHPAAPPATAQPTFGLPASLYEFTFDTTRLAAQLLYNRTLERYPGLRIILSHGGGAIPYLAQRLTYGAVIQPDIADRAPADPVGSLQRIYYDLAMSGSPYALPSLRAFVPASQVLVGTDFPFMPAWTSEQGARHVLTGAGYTDAELRQISRGNAETLFPRTRNHTP
jgi:predicted TIM-barrel fold metal-dependent hydrolase